MRGLLVGLVVALGCGDDGGAAGDAGSDPMPDALMTVCDPGRSEACVGRGGCAGGQVCADDGASWGPCECDDPDGGPVDGGIGESDASSSDFGVCECEDDGNPCTDDTCDIGGECVHPPADGRSCGDGGRCGGGSCCEGCWDGTACQPGDTLDACGSGGFACAACDDGNQCTVDACIDGSCEAAVAGTGSPCDDGNECTSEACDGGTCVATPVATGTLCAGGRCAGGVCESCGGMGEQCCLTGGVETCDESVVVLDGDGDPVVQYLSCIGRTDGGLRECRGCGMIGQFCCVDWSDGSGSCPSSGVCDQVEPMPNGLHGNCVAP